MCVYIYKQYNYITFGVWIASAMMFIEMMPARGWCPKCTPL